jgi:hypothetical protein
MKKVVVPIKYTNREFNSIKSDLMQYAKRYYSDTLKDFSEASFGSLMLDSVAYVGDMLSFYLDYQVNESFLDTAIEFNNVSKIGNQLGYKQQSKASSYGYVQFYIMIPAATTGLGPDTRYIPKLLAGTTVTSATGGSFILLDDVDFADSQNEIVAGKINVATGVPTHYAIKSQGRVVSGRYESTTLTFGEIDKFVKRRIGTSGVTEITSVVDSAGNVYYEVEHLSQNVVHVAVSNENSTNSSYADSSQSTASIMKPFLVARRFAVTRDSAGTYLQFGYGSENELNKPSILDPTEVVLDLHGRDYTTARSFDPSKMLDTDKFGISPANTSLTVTYRTDANNNSSAATGQINNVTSPVFRFTDQKELNIQVMSEVKKSIEASNEEPINADVSATTSSELKSRILGHFAAQNRAVTKQDYITMAYNMPGKFGKIKRANMVYDNDSFKRNMNLYVMSMDPSSNLTTTSDIIKNNLKTWLNRNRMISDTIDIMDAKVINYSIKFKLVAVSGVDKNVVLSNCIQELRALYGGSTNKMDIGEPFYISQIYYILNRIEGVLDVKEVSIHNRVGGIYSDVSYDFKKYTSADARYLVVPENCVLELKYPALDLEGEVH